MLLVYVGLFALFILQPNTDKKFTNNRSFAIVSGLYLFLIAALRNVAHGDLIGYRARYEELLPNTSYSSLFNQWSNGNLKDFGFYAWSKFFAAIGISTEVWFAIIAAIFCICYSYFTCKYSADPFTSLLTVLLFYYSFTFTGLRQTMALAVIFIAYTFMLEKKPIKFVITVLIASAFHSSALIFLPAYLIARLKIGIKQPIMVVISLAVALFAPGIFRTLIERLAWNEALEGYAYGETSLSWAGYIIQLCIFIFCMAFRTNIKGKGSKELSKIDAILNCFTIGLCIQGFASTIAEAFRLSFFFGIGSVVLIPNIISEQPQGRNKTILFWIVLAVLLAYMIWKKAFFDYSYFWM